jgi:hypothetical protein
VIERISQNADLSHAVHKRSKKLLVGPEPRLISVIYLSGVGASRFPAPSFGKGLGPRHQGHPTWVAPLAGEHGTMAVSVSAFQLRILAVAIVAATFGQLVVASIGQGRAATVISNAPAHDPPSALPARAPPSVRAPTVLADADAAPGMLFAPRRDPDDALAIMATLADIYDDTRMSPMWPSSVPSPASLSPAELVRLLGICSGVALCIYGLLAFNLRRRSPFSGRSEPA